MNVYDEHPFKVILDYGHNPAAIQAMVTYALALMSKVVASASFCSWRPTHLRHPDIARQIAVT